MNSIIWWSSQSYHFADECKSFFKTWFWLNVVEDFSRSFLQCWRQQFAIADGYLIFLIGAISLAHFRDAKKLFQSFDDKSSPIQFFALPNFDIGVSYVCVMKIFATILNSFLNWETCNWVWLVPPTCIRRIQSIRHKEERKNFAFVRKNKCIQLKQQQQIPLWLFQAENNRKSKEIEEKQ